MKLNKFAFDALSVAEMNAIKAGSGYSRTGEMQTWSDTQEEESAYSDRDVD